MKTISTLLLAAAALLPAMACERCWSEVPPQPADGAYHISADLPDRDCYWLFLSELRPGEDLAGFLERAGKEEYAQLRRKYERERLLPEAENGHTDGEPHPDVPDVRERGLVLRNPASPEAWRDVVIPRYRDNMMDFPGNREHYYNLFLSVGFSPQGITVCPGKGTCELARPSAPPRFWSWSEASAFLAELPSMLIGDPQQVVTIFGIKTYSQPMRERILSGRRMVVLHTDRGMPIAPYWECLAKMVTIVGGQNMSYGKGEFVVDGIEYERRARVLSGEPEFPDAPPGGSFKTIPPHGDVLPVLDLPGEE